jgi:alkaline phosphatase D
MRRRDFLGLLAAGAATACSGRTERGGAATSSPATTTTSAGPGVTAAPIDPASPFQLGVASGDPLPDAVILWTRLTAPATVDWEVATDEGFTAVVGRGQAEAQPALANSVHVDATGLAPATEYWYRFSAGGVVSPAGRTRTAPAPGSALTHARFAFGSCQDWQDGYYTAHPHLAAEDVDFIVWLGDYIYEEAPDPAAVRPHTPGIAHDLAGYRRRYAQYKTDAGLQAAHAAAPWIVTWDDHEVSNDYAGDQQQGGGDVAAFRARRAAAYQAWYEHQPVRLPPPAGPDYAIQRGFEFGDLLAVYAIDGRQHRSPEVCGGGIQTVCKNWDNPSRTFLGADQEQWLVNGLASSGARWNVIANDVVMTDATFDIGHGRTANMDAWDGYPVARDHLLTALRDAKVANPVAITGDIHASLVGDLAVGDAVVGTEFVGPSISSHFPAGLLASFAALPAAARRVRFADATHHGYVVVDVDADRCQADYRLVRSTVDAASAVVTGYSWVTEAGRPGAQPV